VSDIDTVVVDSLKALDPEWPIREADIGSPILPRNWPIVLAVFPYKGRRHLVSDSGPWPYVSQPTFVLSSANHVNEKHAEATEQQDSACR